MKIKIATVGACVTRDNFNSKFNPNYKMFFDLVLHQNQISIPSLMSKRISYVQDESVSKLNNFNKWHLQTECDKRFFKEIKREQPEYLLLDVDADVNFGVIEFADGEYFTNNPKFTNISFLKKYTNRMEMKDNPDAYFKMWKPKVHEFFSFLKKEVPNCKVILVKARFVDDFRDGTSLTELRKSKGIKTLEVDRLNELWDRLNDYIIDTFDVRVLDMTKKKYYVGPNHPWGAYYLHFEQNFYNDFLNKFQQIIQEDILNELYHAKQNARKLTTKNKKLEKKLNFYKNESFTHVVKRYLLKNSSIRKLNDTIKGRNV